MGTEREIAMQFGGEPRLFFSWHEDRFQHFLVDKNDQVVLQSCDEAEIRSPVFTEIHEQDGLFFLSGNERDSYWSMSVCEFANSSAPGGLTFDIACRAKNAVGRIGAVYSPTSVDQDQLIIKSAFRNPNSMVQKYTDQILISPIEQPSSFPCTVQYSYDIYFLDGSPAFSDFPR